MLPSQFFDQRCEQNSTALRGLVRLSLYHHADERLGDGRADKHSALSGKLILEPGYALKEEAVGHHRLFRSVSARYRHILQHLREAGYLTHELGDLAAAGAEYTEEFHRSKLPVAGSRIIEENDVAGLLSAEVLAIFEHAFKDIPVSDSGALHIQPAAGSIFVEAEVGHNGSYYCAAFQAAAPHHIDAADGHDLVAIYYSALFIYDYAPVGVAIERYADIESTRGHYAAQALRRGGTAAVVYIHPIGVVIYNFELYRKAAEYVVYRSVRRPVRTIYDYSEVFYLRFGA